MSATVSNNTKKNNDKLPPQDDVAAAAPATAKAEDLSRFHEVNLDRPSFKAELFLSKKPGSLVETYEGPVCQGFAIGHVEMPEMLDESTGEMRKWYCYVLQLTAPTKGVDRGNVRDLLPGDQIIVAETALLKQALPANVANHPTHMCEVRIMPIERKPMPDDATRKMWNTKISVAQPILRTKALSGNAIVAGMLASAKTAQLAG